jgi:hypothetical protein
MELESDLAALAWWLLEMPPAQRAAFLLSRSSEDLAVCERAMAEKAAIGWRATPTTMANHLTRGEFKLWRYTVLLGEKFRDAVNGTSKRQIWNLEARYGKSILASQWGPVWALDRDPTTRLILSSYGDALADENADAVRSILRAHSDVLRVDLRRDRQKIDRFVTTAGGGLLAAGIDAGITGFGADGAILDDPFKNWPEAHSQARRDHVDHQYRSVIRLRLETDDSWVIIVHNRWHEDDLSGRLLQQMQDGTGEDWEVVRLPTIAEAADPTSPNPLLRMPDPLGRQPGEILEPERFSLESVRARSLALGSYLSSSMMQQRPAPEEGGEIKRAWFRIEDAMPAKVDQLITSWDMKLKDKETGDYVVGQCWARTGKDCWLLDQLRGQWGYAMTINAIVLMAVRWPDAAQHVIENTGNGPEVMEALKSPAKDYEVSEEMAGQLGMVGDEREMVQSLRRRGLGGIIPQNVKGSKKVRMRAVAPYIEAGDVHLDARATWLGAFLDEAASFPNGGHDDQVDTMSQALARIHKIGERRPPKPAGEQMAAVHASSV